MYFVSALFPVFSGVTLAIRLAHYLKSGKDPVIFSIHSVCLTECLCWWEKGEQAGRKKREGVLEFGWGLGWWRNPDAEARRKPDPRKKGEKAFAEVCSAREAKPTGIPKSHPGKKTCAGIKKRPVI